MIAESTAPTDTEFGSYGLDQCLDLVESAMGAATASSVPKATTGSRARAWRSRCMERCRRRSIVQRRDSALREDGNYHLAIGTAEFGNGTTTVHRQIVSSVLGSTASRVRIVQSDTDSTGYDTGAFASAGTVVAGNAVRLAAEALRERMLDFAAKNYGVSRDACRLEHDAIFYNDTRVPLGGIFRGRAQGGPSARSSAQGLRHSAQRHLPGPGLSHRGQSHHRRDRRSCRAFTAPTAA